MYRCQKCEQVVSAGQPAHKVVVKTRSKEYASRGQQARENFRPGRRPVRPSGPAYDKGGEGRETVQELTLCSKCAAEIREESATQVLQTELTAEA